MTSPTSHLSHQLIGAIVQNNYDLVQDCLLLGADLHQGNEWPFRLAVYKNKLDVAQRLLQNHSIPINILDGWALNAAIENDSLPFILLLIQNGADVHGKNEAPLFRALKKGNLGTIRCLIQHGASLSLGIQYAQDTRLTSLIPFLKDLERQQLQQVNPDFVLPLNRVRL